MTKLTLREKVFGTRLTKDEVIKIETDAIAEGYYDVLQAILQAQVSLRKKRLFLGYVRDGLIRFRVVEVQLEDIYDDDDPFEVDR